MVRAAANQITGLGHNQCPEHADPREKRGGLRNGPASASRASDRTTGWVSARRDVSDGRTPPWLASALPDDGAPRRLLQ
ncbi:unnamed protein product [Boreogadus saida]